ncbi:MAG: apolipoprotein N-acyltransferase, partial [Moraxellaceae bacterium]
KIIIWPEAAVPYIYSDALPFLTEMNRSAADNHSGLITGIIYDDAYKNPGEDVYYNSVVGLGDAIGVYHKRRLVPFGEYVPISWLRNVIEFFNLPTSIINIGPEDQHGLKINDMAIAPSICYEVAYPDLVAQGAVGSQLLMSVSNLGWFGDSLGRHQFMQMAQMRALETRHYYAYSTNNGPSAIFDRGGNVVAQTEAFQQTTLSSEIYATTGSTPFMRWGSVPVVGACLLILISMLIVKLRNRSNEDD